MRGEDLPIKWIGLTPLDGVGASWHKSVMPIRVSRFAIDDHTLTPTFISRLDTPLYRRLPHGGEGSRKRTSIAPAVPPDMEKIEYFQIFAQHTGSDLGRGGSRRDLGGGNLELFTNFFRVRAPLSNDPWFGDFH